MTDDATLSEFSSAGSESEADDEHEKEVVEIPQNDVGAPRTTFAWGSYTCSHCEAATERAWRVDGEFVCPACKPW